MLVRPWAQIGTVERGLRKVQMPQLNSVEPLYPLYTDQLGGNRGSTDARIAVVVSPPPQLSSQARHLLQYFPHAHAQFARQPQVRDLLGCCNAERRYPKKADCFRDVRREVSTQHSCQCSSEEHLVWKLNPSFACADDCGMKERVCIDTIH